MTKYMLVNPFIHGRINPTFVSDNPLDAANKAFEDLMGGETDARKKFIAENSLKVANLDI